MKFTYLFQIISQVTEHKRLGILKYKIIILYLHGRNSGSMNFYV